MKIRIISDIHADINKNDSPYDFGDDFVICCGDVSGDRISTERWIKNNIKKGIIIGGNHLGYNEVTFDEKDTLIYSIKYLQDKFKDSPVYFLENQSVEIEDVIFVGCILFTDFNLFNHEDVCKMMAHKKMNDYRYVKVIDGNKLRKITATDQQKLHYESKKFIEKVCDENPSKKIIVISHHAPSSKSIPVPYKHSTLSAAYASNLEELVLKYKNLKLWCHGHMHTNCNYKLHGTKVICNPRGYYNENPEFDPNGIIVDTKRLWGRYELL